MFTDQNQEKFSFQSLIEYLPERSHSIDCSGLSGSERAYIASRIYDKLKTPIVVIVAQTKEGERFIEDLSFFSKKAAQQVLYFPPYNIMPFKHVAYHNETAANRLRTLYSLIDRNKPPIVVTTVDAILPKLIPKQELCSYVELILKDEEIDRDLLIGKLISGGYVRSAIVEEPGDFCIRGGIIDIFSALYSEPLRIEMLGDRVDSIRFFSATTQRTTENILEAVILPAKEAILKKECLTHIIGRVREQAAILDIPVTRVRGFIRRIKEEDNFPGVESLIPLIYPEPGTIFDYIADNALFIFNELKELENAAVEFEAQAKKNYQTAYNEARLCVTPERSHIKWSAAKEIFKQKKPLTMKMLPVSTETVAARQHCQQFNFTVKDNTDLNVELKRHHKKENLLLPLANKIKELKQSGYVTLLVCRNESQAYRLKSLLEPYHIRLNAIEHFTDREQHKGSVCICLGQVSSGFVWSEESVAIITEDEIFGLKHHKRKIYRKEATNKLLTVEDLKKGDLVVHAEHGIGKYEGLVKLMLSGAENDFLLIIYKDNDKLYLPVDRMNMVQKYMGMDGIQPVLDKMGGTAWGLLKKRVKKSAEKIAGELLKIYAERVVSRGCAYSEPDSYFQDFEAAFPYEETDDQVKAIEDIINDMKKPMPMDRLVCGDVGYGKTEVALRAAFVAVNDGKQVAVLVPTTVLAEQHFATFSSRFDRYPFNVACLSRFRSSRKQRAIINDLKTGKIDIIIGTHRLLQKDVSFKDLGLVVLDEEQRFGVRHKEKLKKIRSTVDVLALTATPIPRTLHMSMMGIRDISVISTPPEHRYAIITYICEFDDAVVAEAIRKELSRNGQLFFVHNNIHGIRKMAMYLRALVPEVRLEVAHGRMDKNELEKVMLKFVHREIDMLVCTTIIESGLDIPSANTILVNRADRFGLAQMYQLRGRVGRADEQAYAYLFIPNESVLGRDAQKRLKVLMEHSDLGSGFQIAMSDLRIRGGGTILGASQSGHIAAVGYDMYLKLMENAIADLKGEPLSQ
ncbi:transcription-repair coupling factor, partial [Thermodesulfobacteriota bacterium]